MTKKYLAYNITRLVVALLAIIMFFVPICSLKLPLRTSENKAHLVAIALIANDREDISDKDLERLIKKCRLSDDQTEEISDFLAGKAPEGKLPYVLNDAKHLNSDDIENIPAPIINDTGDVDDRADYTASAFTLVKDTVKNMQYVISFLTLDVVPDAEELEYDFEMTEEDVERIEETEFDMALLSKLAALGITDSYDLLALSELDTDDIDDDTLEYLLFISSGPATIWGFISTVLLVIIPLIFFFVGLSEFIKLLKHKKKYFEMAPGSTHAVFSYLSPLAIIFLITYMLKGSVLSAYFYVVLAAALACVILAIALPKSVKHNKIEKNYLLVTRIISAVAAVLCVVALFIATSFNFFDATVNKSAYKDSLKAAEERYEDELEDAQKDLERLLKEFNFDNSEQIADMNKRIERIQRDIELDSITTLTVNMVLLKGLLVFYMILIFNYLIALIKRVALLGHTDLPLAYVLPRYIRYIFVIIISIALEFIFGGFVTPFVIFFAVFMALEITLAVFKKVFNTKELANVSERGEKLFADGKISEAHWTQIRGGIERTKDNASTLMGAIICGRIEELYDRFESGDATDEELLVATGTLVVFINEKTPKAKSI